MIRTAALSSFSIIPFKRRRDRLVEDDSLADIITRLFAAKIRPRIKEAFHIDVTRIKRNVVVRHDVKTTDHFSPHRDNTRIASTHRQFACTINLNTDNYEGGNLRFPDCGLTEYRCPTGAALIFSCLILHEALPITRGIRYATLPFFYDESSSVIREKSRGLVGEEPPDRLDVTHT